MSVIRPPSVANIFYPGDPQVLTREIDNLFLKTKPESIDGSIVALILPHAGYQYSGHIAATGYSLLKQSVFDTVVIVSPSHREYFSGISIFKGTAYRTPLGELLVDEYHRKKLLSNDPIIEESQRGHGPEHAIEVQLPFIQKVFKEIKILPIVMGDQRRELCFHLGQRLGEVLQGTNTLLIASTDLSHYHPYKEAEELDKIVIDDIKRFDYEQLMSHLETQCAEACGGGPTVSILIAANKLGANRVKILSHCNSGDVTGDRSAVVGYLSAVVYRTN